MQDHYNFVFVDGIDEELSKYFSQGSFLNTIVYYAMTHHGIGSGLWTFKKRGGMVVKNLNR